MNKILKYDIIFHTDWHCGAGLAAGADVDVLVIKDKDGLPYVPGKTIKGLVREAVDLLYGCNIKGYEAVFGRIEGKSGGARSESFFTSAVLENTERQYILAHNAAGYLYRSLASTAIDDNGIAETGSLRKIQVAVPCKLHGEIYGIDENMLKCIKEAMSYIKRLGQWRNRGLGRCTMNNFVENDWEEKKGGNNESVEI